MTSGGTCGSNMLTGTNSTAYPVVALVSAGPDKTFTTTCRSFATADGNSDGDLDDAGDSPLVSKAAETDDDVIHTFTYEEATAASGGLWSLKSGDPATAVIDKKIEATGTASFQGGILLPDKSLVTCDATTAGVMARNASGNGIEICDGSSWTAISGGGGSAYGSGLVMTPNVSNGMNVTGTCGSATCYGSNVVFTVTNNLAPAATSVPLVVTLTNTTNFEKVSDSCNGVSLAAAANCQIVVRAKATGNVSYAGMLTITGNNSPFAMLDGTASSFPGCNPGGQTTGGYFVGCSVDGVHDLIITPSGCTGGTSNPTCAGGPDTLLLQEAVGGSAGKIVGCCVSNGMQNTVNMMGYSGGTYMFPAASYCSSLVYQGFDDWFLPSATEILSYFWPNRAAVGYTSSHYWGSNEADIANYWMWRSVNMSAGALNTGQDGSTSFYVRCMRYSPAATATVTPDSTPVVVTFSPSIGNTAAETRTSNGVTIYGVTAPVSLSISGGTSAQFSKNGAAYTSSATTVTNGDTIILRATSPSAGAMDTITLTVGSSTFAWKVATAANNVIRVFTTNTTTSGRIGAGGAGAADSSCTTKANTAGIGGNWVAVLVSGANDALSDRLPWNWKRLNNMNGAQVASSLSDFMDGSISAPLNYTENGTLAAASLIWTGLTAAGIGKDGGSGPHYSHCAGWATGSAGAYAYIGDSASVSSGAYFYNGSQSACDNTYRLLCMETTGAAGADGDPDDVYIAPAISYTSGGVATSNTVTVTGIVGTVMVTITPSAGTANIIKNGVSVGAASTLVNNNDTIAFSLTTPAVAGNKNTATLTFGPDSYSWWAGYADNTNIGMMFVTSSGYLGYSMGGLTGADTKCQNAATAAGLNGTWTAVLSSSTVNAIDRIPFNFGEIRRVDQTVLAANWATFWGGSLSAQPNITEYGTLNPATYVYTASSSVGLKYPSSGSYCADWTGGSGSGVGLGDMTQQNSAWIRGGDSYCNYSIPMYCMAALTPAMNSTPAPVTLMPKVTTVSGERKSSAAVTITGISTTTTISVSGSSGTPRFKVNGGPEVSSDSAVVNGDSIVFLMDAPTTAETKNTMTISLGGRPQTWWVGYTDAAKVGHVFVSSTTYTGALGGLAGADIKCNNLATAAGLPGTWTAYLSTLTVNAIDRIPIWNQLKRTDGTIVSATWDDMWYGSLSNPPNRNEYGIQRDASVWTGSDLYGKSYSFGGTFADTWTTNSGSSVTYGNSSRISGGWSKEGQSFSHYNQSLYCFSTY